MYQPAFQTDLHTGPVCHLALTPDGRALASAASDGSLAVWDTTSGEARRIFLRPMSAVKRQLMHEWLPARALALSPDGETLALSNEALLAVYSVATGKQLRKRTLAMNPTCALAFSPDSERLTVGSCPSEWLANPAVRGIARAAVMALGLAGGVIGAAAAGNALDRPGWLIGYDHQLRTRLHFFPWADLPDQGMSGRLQGITSLAYSPDGGRLAAGTTHGRVQLFEAGLPAREPSFWERLNEKGESREVRVQLECGEVVRSVAWIYGGAYLLAATATRLLLWEVASATCRGEIRVPRGIGCLAASATGQVVVTASDDGESLQVWALQSGTLQSEVGALPGPALSVALSADGSVLAAGTRSGPVAVWRAPGSFG